MKEYLILPSPLFDFNFWTFSLGLLPELVASKDVNRRLSRTFVTVESLVLPLFFSAMYAETSSDDACSAVSPLQNG